MIWNETSLWNNCFANFLINISFFQTNLVNRLSCEVTQVFSADADLLVPHSNPARIAGEHQVLGMLFEHRADRSNEALRNLLRSETRDKRAHEERGHCIRCREDLARTRTETAEPAAERRRAELREMKKVAPVASVRRNRRKRRARRSRRTAGREETERAARTSSGSSQTWPACRSRRDTCSTRSPRAERSSDRSIPPREVDSDSPTAPQQEDAPSTTWQSATSPTSTLNTLPFITPSTTTNMPSANSPLPNVYLAQHHHSYRGGQVQHHLVVQLVQDVLRGIQGVARKHAEETNKLRGRTIPSNAIQWTQLHRMSLVVRDAISQQIISKSDWTQTTTLHEMIPHERMDHRDSLTHLISC